MKNFLLCTLMLFLAAACTADSEAEIDTVIKYKTYTRELSFPLNPNNPFDVKGKAFYEKLQLFVNNHQEPNSVKEITEQISFVSGAGKENYTAKTADLGYTQAQIMAILNNPDTKLMEIVENSTLSPLCKSQLSDFVQTLISQQDEQYIFVRDYIIGFDASIVSNSELGPHEKEIILTVSTISSYALFAEAERKDRDWETSVGTRPAYPFFKKNQASMTIIIAMLETII